VLLPWRAAPRSKYGMLWGCPNFFNKTDRCTYTKSRSATTSEPAAADEPDATKANTTDMNTMRRMLVQGVVRVLQSRANELKGELLVSDLPYQFERLWKVQLNLQSAGYSDVQAFLKAWPNKIEVNSSPKGDVVILAKKSA
ncbi:MAG TPA: hypothetical protein HPP54_10725, partial [Nitrospinae bacterium]|nr:hypothetical protein [Nitrospinota bacterium]